MNFDQVYASLFTYRFILEHYPEFKFCFLFGGASAIRPEVIDLFRRLKVDGYAVVGEGERKLEEVTNHWLQAAQGLTAGEVMTNLQPGIFHFSKGPLAYERSPEFFEKQLADLSELPAPDYEEYFSTLERSFPRAVAGEIKNRIRILVEGSRGCFAKCDFCALNVLWKGFRRQKPETVLERTLSLVKKHQLSKVEFVDNVCDAWAEKFSEGIIDTGVKIKSAMALRAHHPEAFWVKLAKGGMSQAQVGIECLSQDLLAKIGKGTTVPQNVLVLKFLAELGVRCTSNLIVFHPMSAVSDVEETKRVVWLARHFGLLSLSYFKLDFGSPLYNRLSIEQKKKLKSAVYHRFGDAVDRDLLGWGYELPDEQTPITPDRAATKAWTEFVEWHRELERKLSLEKYDLVETTSSSGRITINRLRGHSSKTMTFEGDHASVLNRCHRGIKKATLAEAVGISEMRLDDVLSDLKSEELVIDVAGTLISLPKRQRERVLNITPTYVKPRPMSEGARI
jgi:hypothetical protein